MHARVLVQAILATVFLLFAYTSPARGHCDTLNGPVVTTAKLALAKSDVTPVLKWVKKEHEAEIRAAFRQAVAVRTKGPEARELADRYFFETLVRVHRMGEGAPYTGLKPDETGVPPAIAAADQALERGSAEQLVQALTEDAAAGIRKRFQAAVEKKKHAEESVAAGREFVEAYVTFIHYVEALHSAAVAGAQPHAVHEGRGEAPAR